MDGWISLQTYSTREAAQMDLELLQQIGIGARVLADDCGGVHRIGIKVELLVPAEDEQRARELLRTA